MAMNNWKQYGGIRKQDKLHNLTIGTLVADQVYLREKSTGSYNFTSSITVNADTVTAGNAISQQSIFANYDSNVGRNLFVTNKIFLGLPNLLNNTSINLTNYTPLTFNNIIPVDYPFIDGSGTGIGVNEQNPSSALEIRGKTNPRTNETQSDILTVTSPNTVNRSIIAQNVNYKGIVVTANESSSTIDFFNSNTTDKTNVNTTPDSRIQNIGVGGNAPNILSLFSGNIAFNSNYDTTMNTNGNLYLNSVNDISLSATGSIYLKTGKAINFASKGGMQFTDTSNGLYLYDYYENPSVSVGTAVSVAMKQNNATTFTDFLTPNSHGFRVGGGIYVNDTTRSFGSFGVFDNCKNYLPVSSIVAGTNYTNYRTTMGINTYSPKTEQYSLDVNGAVHIGNGEIIKQVGVSFEITHIMFSKRPDLYSNAKAAIAVGKASSITIPYSQFAMYSPNGINWYKSRISSNDNLENTFSSSNFSLYVYNNTFSVIGTLANFLYYTIDGGVTWSKIFIDTPGNNYSGHFSDPVSRNVTKIFISPTTPPRLYINFIEQTSNTNNIEYLDIDYTNYSNGTDLLLTSTTFVSGLTSIINCMDGTSNYMYTVGTGIRKYNLANLTLSTGYPVNNNNTYNHIYVYNDTNAIAVGSNVISYTINGTTWYNLGLSSMIGVYAINFQLYQSYIYDMSNAMVVGDNGIIMYSTNWSQSTGNAKWYVIPDSMLNSSGASARINNPTNVLKGICMYDINTFVVERIVTNYNLASSSGNSNIYSLFLPNLFNRVNNNVLDICGNMTLTGDVNINVDGNINLAALKSNANSFNLLNNTVSIINIGSDASNIYLGKATSSTSKTVTTVAGDASLNNRLIVNGITTLNNDLIIGGNIIPRSTNTYTLGTPENPFKSIYVNPGTIYFTNNDASVNAALSFNSSTGGIDLHNRGIVTTNVTSFEGQVGIGKDSVVANATLDVSGTSIFSGVTTVNDDTLLNQRLYVLRDASFSNRVFIQKTAVFAGDASLNNRLFINGNANLNNQLNLLGDANLNSRLFVNNDSSFSGNFYVNQTSNFNGDVSLNNRLYVFGDASLNNRLYLTGDASLNRKLFVASDLSMNGRLTVSQTTNLVGDVSLNNQLFVFGDVSLNNRLYLTGDASLNSRLFVASDLSMNGRLMVSQTTNLMGDVSLNNQLFVFGDVSFNNRLYLTGDASLNSKLFVSSDLSMNGRLMVSQTTNLVGDVSLNNRLLVIGDTSLNGRLNVVKSTNLNSNLTVGTGITVNSGGINVNGGITLSSIPTIQSTSGNINIVPGVGNNVHILGNLYVDGSFNIFGGVNQTNVVVNVAEEMDISSNSANTSLNVFQSGFGTIANFVQGNSSGIIGNVMVVGNTGAIAGVAIGLGKNMANYPLDVSGTVNISGGSLLLDGSMNINNQLIVVGDVSLNSRLFVNNDATLTNRLLVNKDITTNANLNVKGGSNFVADMSLNNRLFVFGDISANSKFLLAGDASFNGKFSVANDASFNGRVYIKSDLSMGGNVSAITQTNTDYSSFVATTKFVRDYVTYINNQASSTIFSPILATPSVNGTMTFTDSNGYINGNGNIILTASNTNSSIIINTASNKNTVINGGGLSVNGNIELNGTPGLNSFTLISTPVFQF